MASNSPDKVCIVTDASSPPLPLQSVSACRVWHWGDLYDDWTAAGLSTSDDSELQAIALGITQATSIGLDIIKEIHVFSDSTNALRHCMDASHHSGQFASISISEKLVPWFQLHPDTSLHLHHISDGVEIEDHQLVHLLATSTRVEAGGAPVISADFARREAVTRMLNSWNTLFRTSKYIGSNFLSLYQRKDTPLLPTHLNGGPWMRKTGHSHALTARMTRCVTGHAPIGAFRSRFFPNEPTACRCGFPMETVSHVLNMCPPTQGIPPPNTNYIIRGWSISSPITSLHLHSTFPSPIQARGGTPSRTERLQGASCPPDRPG